MRKDDLIRHVAQKLGKHNNDVKVVIDNAFDTIIDQLASGRPVSIVGFGGFRVRQRKERLGRNPKTGSRMTIPTQKTPTFVPGKKLKDTVKGRR